MPAYLECVLCGHVGYGVRQRLTAWKDTADHRLFDFIPRCVEDAACRERVKASGREWPVKERGAK